MKKEEKKREQNSSIYYVQMFQFILRRMLFPALPSLAKCHSLIHLENFCLLMQGALCSYNNTQIIRRCPEFIMNNICFVVQERSKDSQEESVGG